jgi:hypothetical protein
MMVNEYKRLIQKCACLAIKPTNEALTVSIAEQKMTFWRDGQVAGTFSISTGRQPPSCIVDSLGTPTGLHAIADRIGDGEPVGTVFRGRVGIGSRFDELKPEEQAKNLITTRILRLRGLETGHNAGLGCDTYERMVYIHGTNHEDMIGRPNSAGCIELRNEDMLELFDATPEGTLVLIEDS